MPNSKSKGKRGELEWAAFLRDYLGIEARRGRQFKGTQDSPDVICDGDLHFEVKRVEKLNVEQALQQSEDECGDKVPAVAHRRNREDWKVTVRATDLVDFAHAVMEAAQAE